MQIILCSVGKVHHPTVKEIITDYTEKLNHYFSAQWLLIAPPKYKASTTVAAMLLEESKLILGAVKPTDWLIVLSNQGKEFTNIDLCKQLTTLNGTVYKRVVYLIGGAYGVDSTVLKRANAIWCLSPLVFPHMLVRVLLVEQLYRTGTILKNESYHHG